VFSSITVYITNINRLLKGIKSKISANFIHSNNKKVVVITNKIVIFSDLNIVKKYMKELNNVNSNDIISPKLPQFKSYLKILDIPYFIDNINLSVISNIIQRVIKTTHIFDNTVLAFYFCIIKASLKSNMVIVWVDIWDFQNHTKAKLLINRYFNIEYYITTIRGTNMNPSILQCKNC